MAQSPRGKSVLITGYLFLSLVSFVVILLIQYASCSPGGIGHALAKEFHSRGLHVIASARSREAIADLQELGLSTIALEVTSTESIEAARKEVEHLVGGGGLWGLINNAGRNCTIPALEVSLDEARVCFETNLFAVIAITQTFMPMLIQSKGLIINIGSVAAIAPYVFGSVYNASKAALHAYSQTLRLEVEPFGVRVMVVVTGGVESRIARTKRVLVQDSLYLPIETDFERRVSHSQEGAMPNSVYARGVVDEALRQKPKKWVWRGNKAWTVWLVSRWLGSWVFDIVLARMFGLTRLKALILRNTLQKRA